MTAAALAPSVVGALDRWFPRRELAWCGAALLVLVPVGLAWAKLDARTVNGEAVGLKPTRFALSIGVYMLTASWMIGHIRPERLTSLPVRATVGMMIVGCAVELLLITFQAVRARQSHFNLSTSTDAGIYATMGLFAVLFIGAVLPLAWEVARQRGHWRSPVQRLVQEAEGQRCVAHRSGGEEQCACPSPGEQRYSRDQRQGLHGMDPEEVRDSDVAAPEGPAEQG